MSFLLQRTTVVSGLELYTLMILVYFIVVETDVVICVCVCLFFIIRSCQLYYSSIVVNTREPELVALFFPLNRISAVDLRWSLMDRTKIWAIRPARHYLREENWVNRGCKIWWPEIKRDANGS